MDVSKEAVFSSSITASGDITTSTNVTANDVTISGNMLRLSGSTNNWIRAQTVGGKLCFLTNGDSGTVANSALILDGKDGYPGTNKGGTWGTSSNRWNSVYSVDGNYSGNVKTSTLTISSTSQEAHLTFSRSAANYIVASDLSGSICFVPGGGATATSGIALAVRSDKKISINNGTGSSTDSQLHVIGDIYASDSITTGNQLVSSVATGTAPLKVTSTTAVTNLNADMLDGVHASGFCKTLAYSALSSSTVAAGNIYYNTTARTVSTFSGFSLTNPNAIIYSTAKITFTGTNRQIDGLADLSGSYYIYCLSWMPTSASAGIVCINGAVYS